MHTTAALTHAVGDWVSVLMAAERSADAMRAEMDEQFEMLEQFETQAAEPAGLQQAQSRVSARLQQLGERFGAAQQVAQGVSNDLEAAETELRKWCEGVAALRDRIAAVQAI